MYIGPSSAYQILKSSCELALPREQVLEVLWELRRELTWDWSIVRICD